MEARRPDISDFAGRLGEGFRLGLGDGQTLRLELIEVKDRGRSSVGGPDRSCYTLLFRSPGENRFAPQRAYLIDHDDLGTLEIFLVPRGPDGKGMTYEAVYN
jgi:hypothetical protein